jgi:hypothetical protein
MKGATEGMLIRYQIVKGREKVRYQKVPSPSQSASAAEEYALRANHLFPLYSLLLILYLKFDRRRNPHPICTLITSFNPNHF